MTTTIDILYVILLIVAIVVGVLLIANLIRLNRVLKNAEETSTIVKLRVVDLDKHITSAEGFLAKLPDMIKSFLTSFEILRALKDKFLDMGEHKKGERDDDRKK